MTKPENVSNKRPTRKVHVYIYEDQIETLLGLWPRVNVSEIVRQSLDRLIEKAKEEMSKGAK